MPRQEGERMFKTAIRWYMRLLVSQHRLAHDAQYWRPAYYWKALLWSAIGCVAVSAFMVIAIMTITLGDHDSILLANIYNGCVFIVGIVVVLPLALRYNSIAEYMIKQWRSRRKSSPTT